MWSLHTMNGNQEHHLLTNIRYTIGRKDADIVISGDSSVSRKHATIFVSSGTSNDSLSVVVTDTSKFGLFYTRNALENYIDAQYTKVDKTVALQDNDIIRIGVQHTFFRLKCQPLIVVTSLMDVSSQANLKETVSRLGGTVINKWNSDVTHLVMDHIILNVKVTQALASAGPIVTVKFFDELLKAISEKQCFPQCDNFVPTIMEEGLNKTECSFVPNSSRKSLFKNRTFVFFNKKQMKRLDLTCRLAGAITKLVSDIQSDDLFKLLPLPGTAFLLLGNAPDSQLFTQQQFNQIQKLMTKKDLRFIQEHEIGLALLYCCTDVYSNPQCELSSENLFTQRTIPGATFSQDIEVENLPSIKGEVKNESLLQTESLFVSRVPETEHLDSCAETMGDTEFVSKKRSHNISNDLFGVTEQTPPKSIKLDKSEGISFSSDDDNDLFSDFGIGTSKRKTQKVKPAPKRRKESQFQDLVSATSIDVPKALLKKEVSATVLSPNIAAEPDVTDCKDEKFEEFPNSCIDDDSLWTCKSESDASFSAKEIHQQNRCKLQSNFVAEKSVASKMPFAASATELHPDSLHKQNRESDSNCHVKEEAFSGEDAKIVFVASSVPEDSMKIENDNAACLDYAGLCKVVKISLIKKRATVFKNTSFQTASASTGKVKNFKRFVKILPTYKSSGSQTNDHSEEIPKIIGGRDLVAHVNHIEHNTGFDDWGQAETLPESQSQDSNPFDKFFRKKSANAK